MLKKINFKQKKQYHRKKKNKKIILDEKKYNINILKIFKIFILGFLFYVDLTFIRNKTDLYINTKVCLCAIIKKENQYIKFFIEHYKNLGYDHIFLYDNNDVFDEKVEDVIKNYIDDNFVTLIDYRGYRGPRNSPQMNAFYECYDNNNKNYTWISFFDIDEYLVLKPKGIKIKEFLNKQRYKNCPIVKFNWLVFNDNEQTEYENKSFIERFTTKTKWLNSAKTIKSTFRGNLSLNNAKKSYSPHDIYSGIKSCTSSGLQTEEGVYHSPPDYKYGELRHYTRTISEYVNKLKRGRATTRLILSKKNLRDYFEHFFVHNKKTEKKVKIFNEAFNTDFK